MTEFNLPSRYLALTEAPRAIKEGLTLLPGYGFLMMAPKGKGQPVLTLPGYFGADGSMGLLRRYLTRIGYDARPWNIGRNYQDRPIKTMEELMEFKTSMVERVRDEVQKIHDETGQKVALVGWSLGGLYADRLARDYPDLIDRVITLGTPLGDPRGISLFKPINRVLGRYFRESVIDFTLWCNDIPKGERTVPTTIIYSKKDGIVSTDIARLDEHPSIKHVHIRSSHVGYTMNPRAYWAVAKELSVKRA